MSFYPVNSDYSDALLNNMTRVKQIQSNVKNKCSNNNVNYEDYYYASELLCGVPDPNLNTVPTKETFDNSMLNYGNNLNYGTTSDFNDDVYDPTKNSKYLNQTSNIFTDKRSGTQLAQDIMHSSSACKDAGYSSIYNTTAKEHYCGDNGASSIYKVPVPEKFTLKKPALTKPVLTKPVLTKTALTKPTLTKPVLKKVPLTKSTNKKVKEKYTLNANILGLQNTVPIQFSMYQDTCIKKAPGNWRCDNVITHKSCSCQSGNNLSNVYNKCNCTD